MPPEGLPTKPGKRSPVPGSSRPAVLAAGLAVLEAGASFRGTGRAAWMLLFVESGRVRIALEKGRVEIGESDLALVPETSPPASLEALASAGAAAFWARFVPRPGWERRLNAWPAAGLGVRLCRISDSPSVERLRSAFRCLLEDVGSPGNLLSQELAMNDLGEIIFLGARELSRRSVASDVSDEIRRVQDWIIEHLPEVIRVANLAAAAGLSAAHLAARFKRETGEGILAHVLRQRLARAENYLLSTDMGIAEIARRSGFHSAAYFTRSFRKLYGTGPRDYRRRQAGENG